VTQLASRARLTVYTLCESVCLHYHHPELAGQAKKPVEFPTALSEPRPSFKGWYRDSTANLIAAGTSFSPGS
jgi:hypothetical protein